MMSLNSIRELAERPDWSDEETEEFRRAVYDLAEVAVELWELEQRGEWHYGPEASLDMQDGCIEALEKSEESTERP